jgi:hypothetical protein
MSKPTRTDQAKPKVHAPAGDSAPRADGAPRAKAERFEALLRRHALTHSEPKRPDAPSTPTAAAQWLSDEPVLDELPPLVEPVDYPPQRIELDNQPADALPVGDEQAVQPEAVSVDMGASDSARSQDVQRIQELAAKAMTEYLAHTVSRFCNDPAVARGDPWQVRIAVDSRLLPGTVLNLGLSPHWLILRFECSEQHSKNLLSQRLHTLHDALSQAVVPLRDISIDID